MAELIIMPKLGFNMSEGKLVKWYKAEGDSIAKGENLFSVETDKTNMDIEATFDGIVKKLFIAEGDKLPVTLPIAIVASSENENIDKLMAEAMSALETADIKIEAKALTEIKELSKESESESLNEAINGNFDYNVIVIGGGPGGYVAAIKSAQMGKKTAIIEKGSLGGTCLNIGCIPTKVLLRSAEVLKDVKESNAFGIIDADVNNAKLDMHKVQERKVKVVSQLVSGVNGLLNGNGVTIINGEAVLKDKNTVKVGEKIYSADNIIIATGSVSKNLPITIDSKMEVITSTEALSLNEIPKDITIIGGGVIGIEFAYLWANLGSKVTVIEFLDQILPMVDSEITEQVTEMLESMGVVIHTGSRVTEITENAVNFQKAGAPESIKTSKVLMAVGRQPNFSGINAETVGVKVNNGAITTDEYLRTSVNNIYAIGDVNGKSMLAHVASMEAICAVENICGKTKIMEYDKIPSAIYIQPEVASVGLTEKQAIEKYGNVKVGKFPMLANGKAKVAGEERGMVKVILEPRYNEIVGMHLFCLHATDMISEAVVAMNLEGTAEEIVSSIHPHPTISEVIHEAFHSAIGKAIHFI